MLPGSGYGTFNFITGGYGPTLGEHDTGHSGGSKWPHKKYKGKWVEGFFRPDYDIQPIKALKKKIQKKVLDEKKLKTRLTQQLSSRELGIILLELKRIDEEMDKMLQKYQRLIQKAQEDSKSFEDVAILTLLM